MEKKKDRRKQEEMIQWRTWGALVVNKKEKMWKSTPFGRKGLVGGYPEKGENAKEETTVIFKFFGTKEKNGERFVGRGFPDQSVREEKQK